MNAVVDHPNITRAPIDGAVYIPLELLAPSPTNPRKHFDPKKLDELAASIKAHTLLQPILARPIEGAKNGQPLYEIVAGERRWRASKLAATGHIMAILRTMTDFEVLELQLVENLQRDDLHPMEEATGYAKLLRTPTGLQGYANADELAQRIGKSRSYVFQRLKLLDLCEKGREAFTAGTISFSIALMIARLPNAEQQARATAEICKGWGGEPMTTRGASEYIQREFMLALDRAVFKITDATLVPAAGSCRECPKRTGAAPELFEDVRKDDTCTDSACYHAKEEAHRARQKAEAEAKGMEVIEGKAAKIAVPDRYSDRMKGWLALDQVHYSIDVSKTLRKLLGKHTLPVKMLEHPHTKALIEVVAEDDALRALKEAGKIKRAVMPTTSANERQAQDKAKAETAWRSEVARQVVEQAGSELGRTAEFRAELLVEVALLLWHRMEREHCVRVEKLMAWAPLSGSSYDPAVGAKHDARIRDLSSDQFSQYLAACVAARDMHANSYSANSKPKRLLRVAHLLQVDAKAVQQQLKNEAAQRVPKAAKPVTAKPVAKKALTPEKALAAAWKNAKPMPLPKRPKKVNIKYRDALTGSTWSGRGVQPAWLKAELAKGRKLSDFDLAAPAAAPAPATHLSAAAADPFRNI